MRRSITLAVTLVLVVGGLTTVATAATGADAASAVSTTELHESTDDYVRANGSDDRDADGDPLPAEEDPDRSNVSSAALDVPDAPALGGDRGVPCWKLWPQVDYGEPCIPIVHPTGVDATGGSGGGPVVGGDDAGPVVDDAGTGSASADVTEAVSPSTVTAATSSSTLASVTFDVDGSLLCQKLYGTPFCQPTVDPDGLEGA